MMPRKAVLNDPLLLLPKRGVKPHYQAAFGVIMGLATPLFNTTAIPLFQLDIKHDIILVMPQIVRIFPNKLQAWLLPPNPTDFFGRLTLLYSERDPPTIY